MMIICPVFTQQLCANNPGARFTVFYLILNLHIKWFIFVNLHMVNLVDRLSKLSKTIRLVSGKVSTESKDV